MKMFSRQRTLMVRRLLHRVTCVVLLLSVCSSIIPLPVGVAAKDLSERFPCEGRACGCRSAKQCWKKCCCFSHAQKIAWARKNGVTPPESAIAAAESERLEAKTANTGANSCAEPTKSCCSSHRQKSSQPAEEQKRSGSGYVLGLAYQQCQGHGLFWNSLPLAIVPEARLIVGPVEISPGPTPFCVIPPAEPSYQPPIPPPRKARV